MKNQRVKKKEYDRTNRGEEFAKELLHWNKYENNRQMPWKGEKDPYKIWLSEIILQQTRVEQGLKYYQNFIATFPSIKELAAASDDKVFKLWEGLGYYSRCRNLLQTARFISTQMDGRFPKSYDTILSLKGVGAYTAAAIASFAYNLPYAVLDGNVFRVLSRIFDIELPIDSTAGKKEFSALAQSILPLKHAGEYNQAIMDFGATICKPVPLCDDCFFNKRCLAYLSGKQDLLPVKEKKTKIKNRWLNYFIVQHENEVLVSQRTQKDIWQNLFQFVLIETLKTVPKEKLLLLLHQQFGLQSESVIKEWASEQKLSHQIICFQFFILKLTQKQNVAGYDWISVNDLQETAFPRTLQQVIQTRLL